jgi:hypothetical protein
MGGKQFFRDSDGDTGNAKPFLLGNTFGIGGG